MDASSRIPYGEWPARNARMGDVELTWAMLAVKGVSGDVAVLIGNVPVGDYPVAQECSVNAVGYQWSFHGKLFEQRPEGADHLRVRIRSEGSLTLTAIADAKQA